MSYTSKRNLVSVITGIVLTAGYIVYASGNSAPAIDDLKSWAVVMLVFVGIGVGVSIAVQIIFHISFAIGIAMKEVVKTDCVKDGKTTERILKSEMQEDELGKIITLKSSRIGYIVASFGFAAGLLLAAIGLPAVFLLHCLFAGFNLGAITEGIASIIWHERGVSNG